MLKVGYDPPSTPPSPSIPQAGKVGKEMAVICILIYRRDMSFSVKNLQLEY